MPEQLHIFSCRYCGFESENFQECVSCENSHLHIKDLKLGHIEKPANDQFCYDVQSRWPTFIHIQCQTKSIDGLVYQLVGSIKRKGAGIAKV